MFCADNGRDLDEAYTLAKKDLELRQDAGAYETLAWVAFKKGLRAEAESAIGQAMARQQPTASILLHASEIARSGGDLQRAETLLARARRLNPYLVKMARPAGQSGATG
jgi:Tfp pilus assembly protein PilF